MHVLSAPPAFVLSQDQTLPRRSEAGASVRTRTAAIEEGMLTLRDDGLEKVRMGLTSYEEILRVIV